MRGCRVRCCAVPRHRAPPRGDAASSSLHGRYVRARKRPARSQEALHSQPPLTPRTRHDGGNRTAGLERPVRAREEVPVSLRHSTKTSKRRLGHVCGAVVLRLFAAKPSAGNGMFPFSSRRTGPPADVPPQCRTLIQESRPRLMSSISTQARAVRAVVDVYFLDVIDGRAGSFAKRGYLIPPFESVEIAASVRGITSRGVRSAACVAVPAQKAMTARGRDWRRSLRGARGAQVWIHASRPRGNAKRSRPFCRPPPLTPRAGPQPGAKEPRRWRTGGTFF